MTTRRDAGRALFLIPILATGLGLAGAAAMWSREQSQATQRDERAATQIATAMSRAALLDIEPLRGAGAAVADDAELSDAELQAFGDELLAGSTIRIVAHAVPVSGAERAAFEARTGIAIVERRADGLGPAADRATYLPVVGAVFTDPSIRPAIGFDLLSDPSRAAAVAETTRTGSPALSAPVALLPNDRTGYLAAITLRTPAGDDVGVVTTIFAIDDIVRDALTTAGSDAAVGVFDEGRLIAGTLDGGSATRLELGGRPLEVRADDRSPANPWPALVVAVGAVIAGVALAVALARLRNSERAASALSVRLAEDHAAALRLADLGGMLASTRSRAEVVALVADHAAAVVGAREACLAFVEGDLLRTATDRNGDGDGRALVPLGTHLARTDAVRTGTLVTVADVAEYQRAHPDLLADARTHGVVSEAAVPLPGASGAPFGVLDLVWSGRRSFDDADDVRLATLGALVGGTLRRVDLSERESRRAEQLAAFARQLATAATAAEVRDVVAADAPALVGASRAACVAVDASGALEADAGAPADDPAAAAATDRALAGEELVTVPAGAEADPRFAALPLRTGPDVRGLLRVTWAEPVFDLRLPATLRTIADLTAQAFVRARTTDATVRHADALAALAEQLATATTLDQVAAAAADNLPTISDATDVHVLVPGEGDRLGERRERHLLTDVSGDAVGELVVAWPSTATPDAAQQQRLTTALELIEDTVRRVDIQRSTSQALLSLRQRLLRPLPSPPGLELAARYRPTSRPLGMGGDWYDVVERRDGTVAIVIGDVVGHGIPAIATMIHLSTILGGLVRSGTPLDELVGRATSMLDVDGMVATAQVIVIDRDAATLQLVSAGHPPPLLRTPEGGVTVLPVASDPPLGVGTGSGRVARAAFPPGAVVLGYTDGLVERRGEPIDTGIGRLAAVLAAANGSVWGTIGRALGDLHPDDDNRGDDIAIVVARRVTQSVQDAHARSGTDSLRSGAQR